MFVSRWWHDRLLTFDWGLTDVRLEFDWHLTGIGLMFDWSLTDVWLEFDWRLTDVWLEFDWRLLEFDWRLTGVWLTLNIRMLFLLTFCGLIYYHYLVWVKKGECSIFQCTISVIVFLRNLIRTLAFGYAIRATWGDALFLVCFSSPIGMSRWCSFFSYPPEITLTYAEAYKHPSFIILPRT